jgi:hypothetical protein
MITIPEEVLLLAYRDDGTTSTASGSLDLGLAAGVLVELALAERIDVVDGKVIVTNPAPTGQPIFDRALAAIAAKGKPAKPKNVLGRLTKGLRDEVAGRLVEAGILRREKDKVLWIFPRTKLPAASGVQPVQETEARARLRAAVLGTAGVDERTGALASLVQALRLEKEALPELDAKQVKQRLKEISQGQWSGAAVRAAIQEIEAATMVAITAATTAATTSSS